jgi:hypothetical protein
MFSLSLLGSLEGLVDVFSGQTRVAVAVTGVAAAATARVAGGAVFVIVADGSGRGGGTSGKHGVGVVGDVFKLFSWYWIQFYEQDVDWS